MAACILAANLPDIDVFFGWAPWAPLAMHRGFTHGLVGGVLLLPPVLALMVWMLDLWQVRRGSIATDAPPMHFGWLLTLTYFGAITHPLLDLQNVYAVQLMSPLSEQWFHSDGLFIVSPWLLAMLGLGIWRSRRRHSGRAAIGVLAACVIFITGNIGISALAWAAPSNDAPYAAPDRIFASPAPIAFWRRDMFWRQDGAIARGRFDPLVSLTRLVQYDAPVPDNMGDPIVRRAIKNSAEVRDFLAWAQMPMAQVTRKGCEANVTFGDARYSDPAVAGSFTAKARLTVC